MRNKQVEFNPLMKTCTYNKYTDKNNFWLRSYKGTDLGIQYGISQLTSH